MCYVLDKDESFKNWYYLATVLSFFLCVMSESFITVPVFQQDIREAFTIQLDVLVASKDSEFWSGNAI